MHQARTPGSHLSHPVASLLLSWVLKDTLPTFHLPLELFQGSLPEFESAISILRRPMCQNLVGVIGMWYDL